MIVVLPGHPGERDRKVAAIVLKAEGWQEIPDGGPRPGPFFTHPDVDSKQQARERLRHGGLVPEDFHIDDRPDDQWDLQKGG